jgi:hypothetical protein
MSLARALTARNVIFAVLGVLGLVLKPRYSDLPTEIVYSYGGNVSVSFALYFVIVSATLGRPHSRILAASIAMVAVTIFEITNGFGFMENVYDPLDILANAVGIGLAAVIDIASTRLLRHISWVD